MKEFIKKHYIVLLVLVSILAIAIRVPLFSFKSGDYIVYLKPWIDEIKLNGGLKALSINIGNYNPPYMTILAILSYIPINSLYSIKIVSVVFDFILAFASGLLCKELVKKNKDIFFLVTYAAVLFIPQVITNSAMWAQCDSIYTSFVILSLLFLIKEKYPLSFILLGVSFAFKLQFIFILPLYVILFFTKRKFSILNFLFIPLMDLVLSLPSIILGKPIKDVLLVYFNQTKYYENSLVKNFPNIYNLFNGSPQVFYKVGVIVALLVCLAMLIYCLHYKIKWNNEKIITLGLYSVIITTYLLPGMHDRYLYVGEVLSVLYLIAYRKNIYLPIILLISTMYSYCVYLIGEPYKITPFFSIAILAALLLFTKYTFTYLKGD